MAYCINMFLHEFHFVRDTDKYMHDVLLSPVFTLDVHIGQQSRLGLVGHFDSDIGG